MLPVLARPPAPTNYLYRLTIQSKGLKSDVYSMSTSVNSAFDRYLERLERQKESALGVVLIHGERADPHAS